MVLFIKHLMLILLSKMGLLRESIDIYLMWLGLSCSRGITLNMWNECVLTAVNLINMLPYDVLSGRSPYELIYKSQPSLSHLRSFSSLCFEIVLNNTDKFFVRVNDMHTLNLFDNPRSNEPGDDERDINTKDDGTKSSSRSDVGPETNLADVEGFAGHSASTNELDTNSLANEDTVRRSSRRSKLPSRLQDYELDGKVEYGLNKYINYANLNSKTYYFMTNLNKTIEPKTYREASTDSRWVEARNNEMEALNRNNTWIICDLPKGRRPIGCIWIYRIKYKANGEVERYNAELVTKGYSQIEGFDYEETFSLVVKMELLGNDITEINKLKTSLSSKILIKGCKLDSTPIEINPNKPNANIINKDDYPLAMHGLLQFHLKLAFKVLRYLKGTLGNEVFYKKDDKFESTTFVDSDWAKSKPLPDDEYMPMSNVACEIIWILKLLTDLKVDYTILVEMFYDSNAAMQIVANLAFHERTKHFEIDFYFSKRENC
ncbi:putative RNA-directed DNA polymerase [Tanacetum coccineum]